MPRSTPRRRCSWAASRPSSTSSSTAPAGGSRRRRTALPSDQALTLDQYFWFLGRVAGLGCFAALSISLVTGVALRSGLFGGLTNNRALKSTHTFTAVLWIPLGFLHVASLVLDQTARVSLLDLFVPFLANYDAGGRLALGLGTIGLDLFVAVSVTGWLRSRI